MIRCVGGVADGEWVNDNGEFITMASTHLPTFDAMMRSNPTALCQATVETSTYRKTTLQEGKRIYPIYMAVEHKMGLVETLLRGYISETRRKYYDPHA